MLEIENIDVYYGAAQALEKVSLVVSKGEIVVIAGSNGAGKSTLLRTVSGLLRPRSGSIRFLGEPIQDLPPHEIVEKGISHVPEGRRLFPFMTVKENLELGCYNKEAMRKREETLEWVFALFPVLKEREKQLAGTLSGGEQQMLTIGRGLMSCPKLILLDEPSLGLAPVIVQQLFDVIANQIRQKGITVLLVEQNVRSALRLADRAYIFEDGRIVLEGEGKMLLNNGYVKKAYLGF